MKIKSNFNSGRMVRAVCLVAIVTFCTARALASTTITNEFWISTTTNGNLYINGAAGTIDNPLDGSSQTNFDNNMQNLPPYSTIHILAGTYSTLGANYWYPKSGQKILGSGMDVTILRFPTGFGEAGNFVIGSYYASSVTNVEVSDLTCDCNSSFNSSGIELVGTENQVRRVKVVNIMTGGASYHEGWGIILLNNFLPKAAGNTIEDCEVSSFAGGPWNLSAIGIFAWPTNQNPGVVRGCRVLGSAVSTNGVIVAYIGGSDCLFEGNYAENVQSGFRTEQAMTNFMLIGNKFKNCGDAVELRASTPGTTYQNLTFVNNQFELTNSIYDWAQAFLFYGEANYNNVNIYGNTVSFVGTLDPGQDTFLGVANVTGLNVAYNTVDATLTNQLLTCTNVNIDYNYDLTGNYLDYLNMPRIGETPVTGFGLSLMGSAGASPALTALGLPSNPTLVVTNGSTYPVVIDTNLTVNGNSYLLGNVGIGTSSPSQPLTVVGNASVSGLLAAGGAAENLSLSALSTVNGCVAEFLSNNTNDSIIRFGDQSYNHLMYIGVRKFPAYDAFEFLNYAGDPDNPMMVIDSNDGGDGNVGIGTNAPSQRLTVSGNVSVTGTNFASYFNGDMSQGINYNAGNLTGTEPLSVVNPAVSTNKSFFILPPDAVAFTFSGTANVTTGPIFSPNQCFVWLCPSNCNGSIIKSLPLPNDYWSGKTSFVTSWKIRTTVAGSYSFTLQSTYIVTNEVSSYSAKTIIYTAPSGTNTVTIIATNTVSTPYLNYLDTTIYLGNQTQPGNYSVLYGKVTAQ